MFPPLKAIRTTAKHSLSPYWPQAFAITFLMVGLLFLPGFVFQIIDLATAGFLSSLPFIYPLFSGLHFILIIFPLFMGIARWAWIITGQAEAHVSVIFHYFSSFREYVTVLKLIYAATWRLLIPILLFILPDILRRFDFSLIKDYIAPSLCLNIIDITLSVLALLMCIWVFVRIFHLIFVVINHPTRYMRDNVKESITIAKKTRFPIISFMAANGGWYLLSFLMFPLLYTLPYLIACWAVMTRFSINYCLKK